MKTCEDFARNLDRLLAGDQAARFTVSGYMPLSIEDIGRSAEGGTRALAHRRPERRFDARSRNRVRDPRGRRHPGRRAGLFPQRLHRDAPGVVYRYSPQGRRTHLLQTLKKKLRSFARTWFRSLRAQGFFGAEAVRQGLG